ncbi:MAG: hypothetical protein AAFQ53_14430 [Bacteroidota bacterium]
MIDAPLIVAPESAPTSATHPRLALRFSEADVAKWSRRFSADSVEARIIEYGREANTLGCFSKEALCALCNWKSPRSRPLVLANPAAYVEEVTATSLLARSERLRIEVLLLLRGVGWPSASVLLHFGHSNSYPILDVRALWSLGCDASVRYTFGLWWEYVEVCRGIAKRTGLSMRELDQALWQYAAEQQGTLGMSA